MAPDPLDAKRVECIARLAASGTPYREIARECGVSVNTALRYASLAQGPCLEYLARTVEALRRCEGMLDFLINYVPQQLPSGVREWYLMAAAAKLRELQANQPQGNRLQ